MAGNLTVAVDKDLIDEIDKLAALEMRNRSSMLRVILAEGVRHRKLAAPLGVRHPHALRPRKAVK